MKQVLEDVITATFGLATILAVGSWMARHTLAMTVLLVVVTVARVGMELHYRAAQKAGASK